MAKGYFTLIIPFVPPPFRTEWHPTIDNGPFSSLSRGAFPSISAAIAWAINLNGTPYSIRFVPSEETE